MKRLMLLGSIVAMMLSMVPARAGSTTATYAVSFGRLIVNAPAQAGNVGVGGYSFTVSSGDPDQLTIVDQSGPGTAVMVCQEAGAVETASGSCQDGQAGQVEGDDIVQKLCATGSPQNLRAAFAPGTQTIAVFVYTADVTLREPNCSGAGTTGTLRLTF